MRNVLCKFFVTTGLICVGSNLAFSEPNPLARDLIKLTDAFEGQFDNEAQVWFENDWRWKGDDAHKHRRNHAVHVRVEAPQFGEYVFYVEEYSDDDINKIWRQRIASFDIDSNRGLRMRLYFIKDAEKYTASNAAELIAKLPKDSASNLPECDVWFARLGEQYHGSMDDKTCVFGEGDKRRYSQHDIILSENQYWRIDKTWLLSNGELHAGEKSSEHFKMRRANIYTCEVRVPAVSYIQPDPKDAVFKDLILHSQGGKAEFVSPKDGKTYYLQLREKEYPYYKTGADFFLFRIREVGAKLSLVTVTTEPKPRKLSANVGSMLAFCELIED